MGLCDPAKPGLICETESSRLRTLRLGEQDQPVMEAFFATQPGYTPISNRQSVLSSRQYGSGSVLGYLDRAAPGCGSHDGRPACHDVCRARSRPCRPGGDSARAAAGFYYGAAAVR